MTFLLLAPPIFSLLLLAAHFMRLDLPVLMALPLLTIALLALPKQWVAHWTRLLLLLSACEWIRITLVYVAARQEIGMPWARLAVILGTVAAWTLVSALVFQSRPLRQRYKLN